jgi:hypothetical protein
MLRGRDLDQVVGDDAMAAPGSSAIDASDFGAVPAVASFEVIDSAFGYDPPFDLVRGRLAGVRNRDAPARDRHGAHAERVRS